MPCHLRTSGTEWPCQHTDPPTTLRCRDMGCTSFVPGTHQIVEEPRSVWEDGVPSVATSSSNEARTAFQGQAQLPHVRFAGKAGDCCIMYLRTWHTAMVNTTDRDRYVDCPRSACTQVVLSIAYCAEHCRMI